MKLYLIEITKAVLLFGMLYVVAVIMFSLWGIIMKQTKRQRRTKVPARPQVTPRKWSKKSVRIFDKQFDRFLYDELYVPTKKAWAKMILWNMKEICMEIQNENWNNWFEKHP